MRTILTSLFFSFFTWTLAFAQVNAPIQLLENSIDLGRIFEENGPVTRSFRLVNASANTVWLDSLSLDCGCTSSNFEVRALEAGDTVSIDVTYNPFNRRGSFRRLTEVFIRDYEAPLYLQMEGFVVGTLEDPVKDFPYATGNLRFRTKFVNLGNLTTNDTLRFETEIYNAAQETIHLVGLESPMAFIRIGFSADTIVAGGMVSMSLDYMAPERKDIGFFVDSLALLTSDKIEPAKSLILTSSVQEYFPPMSSSELAQAASMAITAASPIDLGTVKKGTIQSKELSFTNDGRSTLEIRKVLSNSPSLRVSTDEMSYAPGQSGKLRISFDTAGASGTEYKAITLFTNDPRYPVRQYLVKIQVN